MVIGLTLAAFLQAVEPTAQAAETRRIPAPEADQGVAVDARYIYAVDNNVIAKYDRATGARVGEWRGDETLFPHLNSCARIEAELVCAHSNYPATPQASSIEIFDPETMTHVRSVPLGTGIGGSLTVAIRHRGAWWLVLANYDARGGEPGRDHRFTQLVRMDDAFQRTGGWRFPDAVLERLAPSSVSGADWGGDGKLYVTGHDRPELYVLSLPAAGTTLVLNAVIAVPTEGQAIDLDPDDSRVLWSIDRHGGAVVESRLPAD